MATGEISCTEKKYNQNEEASAATALSNKESITLIWFDKNIGMRDDTKQTQKMLREVNDFVLFHASQKDCIHCVQSIKGEKIFLVVSGSCSIELLPQIHELPQVDSIFIFCMKQQKYQHLLQKYSKVVSISTQREPLIRSIQENVDQLEKHLETYSFYDQHPEKAGRDLTKESVPFLFFQLVKYVILKYPSEDQAAKQEMLQVCGDYYRGNAKQLKLIDEFEKTYQSKHAINWYTKESFIYKLINKALRTEDIEQLHIFRFFIIDLCQSLKNECEELKKRDQLITSYRGAKVSKEEFKSIEQNIGNLISTNGFLSTSRSRQRALGFARKPTLRTDIVPVLYEIQCNLNNLNDSVVLADIAKLSDYPDEQEILFGLGETFEILSVEKSIDKEDFHTVQMRTTAHGTTIAESYISWCEEQMKSISVAIMYGQMLFNMQFFDKALRYFGKYLVAPNGEDIGIVYNKMGICHEGKKEYSEALKYYLMSYNKLRNSVPKQLSLVKQTLNNLIDQLLKLNERNPPITCMPQIVQAITNELETTTNDYLETMQELKLLITSGVFRIWSWGGLSPENFSKSFKEADIPSNSFKLRTELKLSHQDQRTELLIVQGGTCWNQIFFD